MTDVPTARERGVGSARIRIVCGDVTLLAVDGIVNAANDRLWMGGGVAGAIKRRGGPEIEREAIALGPVPIGGAVATAAGRLGARYVIHAVTMGQDLATGAGIIREATRSALRVADSLGLRSVAFPALGTGVGGFPSARAAAVMLQETAAHLRAGSSLDEVVFALYDVAAYDAFVVALDALV
ncbi:MAG TPA: macro domain-containing protein [bacterium]|nr:macro domain-containing protein [bacterium]